MRRPTPEAAGRSPLRSSVACDGQDHRQADDELAAHAVTVAPGLDGAAVHLDQALDQREADAQAALRPFERPIYLGKHLEDPRQHVGRDADAGIAHAHHGVASLALDGERDLAAALGVLGGVVEQVGDDLCQPGHVGVDEDEIGRKVDNQVVAGVIDQRPTGFDCLLDYSAQLDALLAEFDLALG